MVLNGSTRSKKDPRAPKTNLFTRRWSPTRRLSSIEGVGILNACTINVVHNTARITVITSYSKSSLAVYFLYVMASAILRFFPLAPPTRVQERGEQRPAPLPFLLDQFHEQEIRRQPSHPRQR